MFLLTANDVNHLCAEVGLDKIMDSVIAALEGGFKQYTADTVVQPVRAGFYGDGLIEWMPVHHRNENVTLKMVSYFPENPDKNKIPTVQAYITRNECATGRVTEMVEGSLMTAIRTGAASAVASKVLARPDSRVLGLVGCGVQSITQAHAILRSFPIEKILVFDTCLKAMASIQDRLRFLDVEVSFASVEEIEAQSDIICTATSVDVGAGPVLSGSFLQDHVHINAVGADYPGKYEVPINTLKSSLVIPDFKAQAVREGESQNLNDQEIGPELHELVKEPDNWASWQNKKTVFDSTGIPYEDSLALDVFCALAREYGVGVDMDFFGPCADPKNPYGDCVKEHSQLKIRRI